MMKKTVQMDESVPAQRAASPEQVQTQGRPGSSRRNERHHRRIRSMSLSLSWKRPKSSTLVRVDALVSPRRSQEVAVDDSEDSPDVPPRRSSGGRGRAYSAASAFKGAFRRASMSFKEIVHRRLSVTAEAILHEDGIAPARPTTSQAARDESRRVFTQPRSSEDVQHAYGYGNISQLDFALPDDKAQPAIVAHDSGAENKATQPLDEENGSQQTSGGWVYPDDDDNDTESGIGIVISETSTEETAGTEGESMPEDAISRVDFITRLPVELAIQVLANLDAPALIKASLVSKGWKRLVANQHIWRESCLRESTTTYATGGPIEPGSGLGVPLVLPTNDWKEIYRVKTELNQRWKEGLSRPVYLNGHTDSIYCLQFDEYKIVSGSRDKTIRIWDMKTLECTLVIGPPEVVYGQTMLRDAEGKPTHYAAYPDNHRSALSTPNVVSFPEHHKASILCLQYDDEILVTGSSDFSCLVYDVKDGYRPIRRLRHHTAAVLDLTFDKKHIVTCSKDISICVWDRETGALLRQLRGHTGPVNAVQMRGNSIVSCSGDFRVKLWNIDTGKNIREFVGHTKGLACSQFSEDGRYVASAGNDKIIRIWDANTGECVREMKAHDNLVRSLHIDSVSGRLISGSYDTDIKVWDMETGHQLLDFPRWHASWVLSAKSDYRRIVSTGQDPKILIMDFGADVRGIELLANGRPAPVRSGDFI